MPGPIGSGEAVITDQNSPIRSYLTKYNEKIVAVETEAAGVAEAFYAQAGQIPPGHGWLAIRGISDRAIRTRVTQTTQPPPSMPQSSCWSCFRISIESTTAAADVRAAAALR